MFRKFCGYYKPFKGWFAADMFCAFSASLCDLFYPMITRIMIDEYIPQKQVNKLVIVGIIMLVLYLIKMGLNYFIQYYGHVIGVGIQSNMRKEIFSHLQKLPFTFFDNNKTGSLMSRVVNDLQEISELAHHGPEDLFLSMIMLIGSFLLMWWINPPLTLIIFAFLPALIFFTSKKRKKMSDAFNMTREQVSEVNANLENSISGIRVSKSFVNLSLYGRLSKSRISSTYFKLILRFAFCEISSLWFIRISATPEPTTPCPIIATSTISVSSLNYSSYRNHTVNLS